MQDEAGRRPGTEAAQPGLDRAGIDEIPVHDNPDRAGGEDQEPGDACEAERHGARRLVLGCRVIVAQGLPQHAIEPQLARSRKAGMPIVMRSCPRAGCAR